MKRIILHWTAGGWAVNASDRRAYHYVIDFDPITCTCRVVPCVPVDRNRAPLGAGYAPHTLNANTDSIGVSLACMRGARESPFHAGDNPMTVEQFELMIDFVRELAREYGIPITPQTVLSHAEVTGNLGIQQRGKWDFTRLPFLPDLRGARAIGDYIRSRITQQPPQEDRPVEPLPPVPAGATAVTTARPHLIARSGPSQDSERLGEFPPGTVLEVVGQNEDGTWCEVQSAHAKAHGYTRWVSRRYLDIIDGPPVEEPTTPHPKRVQAAQLRAIADQLEAEADQE